LVAAPIVVVGLGLALVERVLGDSAPAPVHLARRLHPVGAVAATASVVVGTGGAAALLATVWFVVCLCAGAGGVAWAWRWRGLADAPRRGGEGPPVVPLSGLTVSAGLVHLTVGGAWLVVSRLDARPLDLTTDVVRLAAVHFHYAGFGLAVLAATGLASVDWLASRVSLVLGCAAAVIGPPVVAAGIVSRAAVVEVGGTLVMTIAAWAVGFGTFLLATSPSALQPMLAARRTALQQLARSLLVVSALSPIVPMLLALQWALAQHTGLPALSTHAMASTHGVLNGVGFVIAGLAGWLLTLPRPAVWEGGAEPVAPW
jgi:hypothetical protein